MSPPAFSVCLLSPLFRILDKENVSEGLLDSYIIYQPSSFDPCLDRSGYNRSLMGTSSFPLHLSA